MSDTDNQARLREHLKTVILERIRKNDGERKEALRDFLIITMPGIEPQMNEKLAEIIPSVMPTLYEKWIGMFTDRLFETVPMEQLEDLCDGSINNNATIVLIYLMFLESERMEQQIQEDLLSYGLDHSNDEDMGAMVAQYLRLKQAQLGEAVKKEQQQ